MNWIRKKKLFCDFAVVVVVLISFCHNFALFDCYHPCNQCSGLMVSVLVSGTNIPGLSPGWGYRIVFLSKALHSHSASLHPDVLMGTGNLMLGVTL